MMVRGKSDGIRLRRHRCCASMPCVSTAICILSILAVGPSAAITDNVTAQATTTTTNIDAAGETDTYEMPSRIRERDDDREADVDPVEMEGMTAALAKHFAESLVHKLNQEEEIMRAHDASSSSAGSSRGASMHLPVLTMVLTCFLSFGGQVPIYFRFISNYHRSFMIAAMTFMSCVVLLSLPVKALQVPSSQHRTTSARRTSLCAIGASPHDDMARITPVTEGGASSPVISRRSALANTVFGSLCFTHIEASYADTVGEGSDELYLALPLGPPGADGKLTRPSAPVEYLIPAARVGVYVYETFSAAEVIAKLQKEAGATGNNSSERVQELWTKLDALILSPPTFIKPTDPKVSRGDAYGGAPPIIGELGVAAKKRQERREQSIEADFASTLFEPGQIIGERRSWNQLQKAEMKREAASEVRRALNIYTTNLNFNRNKYSFKGSASEKSELIRSDRLPTATEVIRSDLDTRDLFKVQLQTALEDAKAEYIYIKKECDGDATKADLKELVGLLSAAQEALDKWFGFIPGDDVKEALSAVQREMGA